MRVEMCLLMAVEVVFLNQTNIARSLTVKYIDRDNNNTANGKLDVAVCFTWRIAGSDSECNPNSTYPGSPSKCFVRR
jgi:hypothetical protein